MNLNQKYNSLHGTIVSRKTLERLLEIAEKEKNKIISKRIIKVLEAYDDDKFLIEIQNLVEPFGLNGSDMEILELDELNEIEEETGLNGIPQAEIYELITNKIIADLENDHKWESGLNDNYDGTFYSAYNFKTKKPYRGINQLLLGDMFGIKNLKNPYYLTFNQVKELGGTIKKGASSQDAIFYTIIYKHKDFKTNDRIKFIQHLKSTKEFSDEEIPVIVYESSYGILRIYNVFNGSDIEGIDFGISKFFEDSEKEAEIIEIAENIIKKYPAPAPGLKFGGKQPFYERVNDYVQMPKKSSYNDIRVFYAVMFHELIHSTGAPSRLNREKGVKFADSKYAFEELVAEIGSCFLTANCGFLYYVNKNANAYIKGWRDAIVKELKEDNKGIFKAAAMAQKAADFMLSNITEKDYEVKTQKIEVKKNRIAGDNKKRLNQKQKKPISSPKKDFLEKTNPEPFSIKPKSVAIQTAIKDILGLPKYSKTVKPIVATLLYNLFKDKLDDQVTPDSEYEKSILKNDSNFHFSYGGEDILLTSLGIDFVDSVNRRLESLRNQKHNYSFFDGLKGISDSEKKADAPKLTKTKKNIATKNKNSLAYKLANKPKNVEYFKIDDKEISDFLGKIERKNKESVFISITGGQGSMKTRFAFQFMNAMAQNYKVGHASIEEHPESAVYFDKVAQYLNEKALNNIEAPEIRTIADIDRLAEMNDVIVIDSYTKAQEIEKSFEVDKDLRKKYDGKLFLVIFQQTTDGKMRGGSKSQFDADIVMFTKKEPDYRNNYVYHDKNRYQDKPLDNLHFNIYSGRINNTEPETQPVEKPKLSFEVN